MDQTDAGCRAVQPEYLLTACGYRLNNRGYRNSYRENQRNPPRSTGGFLREKGASMSLSSARNYALRAARSQDEKEAIELLSKAILELAASIEDTDSKVKRINKSVG